jgi:flagellar hook-length control protein FliK
MSTLALSTLGLTGQLIGHALGSHKGANASASSHLASNFGSLVTGQTDALGQSDPLAALAAQVQNGTPISSIVQRLASQIAGAVQQQLPAGQQPTASQSAALASSIQTALSPPSNAPPGTTAAQQVATLAKRLEQWLSGIAGEAGQQVGQQNDIAGSLLDASSAKELPAHQDQSTASKSASTSATASSSASSSDLSALAQSLLASVAASFGATSTGGSSTPNASDQGLHPSASRLHGSVPSPELSAATTLPASGGHATPSLSTATATAARTSAAATSSPVSKTGAQTAEEAASSPAPAVDLAAVLRAPTPSSLANASGTATPAPSTGAVPSASTNLLARILIRAAGVDAQVNGPTAGPVSPGTPQAGSGNGNAGITLPATNGGGGTTPGLSTGTLASLTNAILSAAAPLGGNTSGGGGTDSRDTSDPSAPFTTGSTAQAKSATQTSAVDPFAVAQTPVAASTQTPAPAPSANATPVLDNEIIDQVVKGMQMRSNIDGTSELRLRLQPDQLGSVTLKLTVNGSSVSASAVAQNADVRNALIGNQDQLARSLADAGLKLTSFTVDLSSNGEQQQQQQQQQSNGFGRRYTVHEMAGSADADTAEASSSGPPLVSGSSLGLLSYLA